MFTILTQPTALQITDDCLHICYLDCTRGEEFKMVTVLCRGEEKNVSAKMTLSVDTAPLCESQTVCHISIAKCALHLISCEKMLFLPIAILTPDPVYLTCAL